MNIFKKAIIAAKTLLAKKEFRFLFVGGLNTAVGYGSYAAIIYLSDNYKLAYVLSNIIGITHSYFWNKFYTFRKQSAKKMSVGEITRFLSVYLVSFCIGLFMLWLLVEQLGMNDYIAGFVQLLFTTLISWFGHNKFSFKK